MQPIEERLELGTLQSGQDAAHPRQHRGVQGLRHHPLRVRLSRWPV